MGNIIKTGDFFEDKYEILEVLGSGGVGTVYKARQTDIGRVVALKVLHGYIELDDEYKARLTREAQVLSKLEHANIVTVYGLAISESGSPYLVMEYLKGKSLRAVLGSENRLPVLRSLKIIRDTAEALAYVHKNNIVHRDLKPENIFLCPLPAPDTVKILDFGLARLTNLNDQKLTCTGLLIGTPGYMSPEQCEGKSVDLRSDIYSLTVCLYELLTGSKPFTADTPIGVIYKQKHEPVPEIKTGQVDSFVPVINELISRGMSKNPEQRHRDMGEFIDDLDALRTRIDSAGKHLFKCFTALTGMRALTIPLLLCLAGLVITALMKSHHHERPLTSTSPVLQTSHGSRQHLYRDGDMTMREMDALVSAGHKKEAHALGELWLEKYSSSGEPGWGKQIRMDLADMEQEQTRYADAYRHAQEAVNTVFRQDDPTSYRVKTTVSALDYLGTFLEKMRTRKAEIHDRLKKRNKGSPEYRKLLAELQQIEALPELDATPVYEKELVCLATYPMIEDWLLSFRANAFAHMGLCEYYSSSHDKVKAKKHMEEALETFKGVNPGELNESMLRNAVECHRMLAHMASAEEARSHLHAAIILLCSIRAEHDAPTKQVSSEKMMRMLTTKISNLWLHQRVLNILTEQIFLDAQSHQYDHSFLDVKVALDYVQQAEGKTAISSDTEWCAIKKELFNRIFYLATTQFQNTGNSATADRVARLVLLPQNKKNLSNDELKRWEALLTK